MTENVFTKAHTDMRRFKILERRNRNIIRYDMCDRIFWKLDFTALVSQILKLICIVSDS